MPLKLENYVKEDVECLIDLEWSSKTFKKQHIKLKIRRTAKSPNAPV